MYRIEETENEAYLVEDAMAEYGGGYTYADYYSWKIQERLELLKGRIFKMSAPNRIHQEVSGKLYYAIAGFLKHKTCKVYSAPFDIRLPVLNRKRDEEVTTVVQPDICVICDPTKLDVRGCCGAPDLVVEILSPGNSRKEIRLKFDIYEESGVSEYWVVHPSEQTLSAFVLGNDGKYGGAKIYAPGDAVYSKAVEGLKIDVSEIFES